MRNLLVLSLLALPVSHCIAQTKPVEPTAIGVVYRLDPTTQELKPLPNEQWKAKASLTKNDPEFISVQGKSSSFRVKSGEKIEFVFKTGSPEQVALYKFVSSKDKRKFQYRKVSRNSDSVEPIKGLPAEVSTFGERSYKLVPVTPLAPGEYAINISGEVYTFGVD